ncbi:dTMP kinase, partial [Lacticaseibacillus rhamnosus]|nr:dTMP kinase [Lacticaseibacillus rhamnosus]
MPVLFSSFFDKIELLKSEGNKMITGKLITVEGPEGAGKTTVLEQLIPLLKPKVAQEILT